jgi:hypothetical protein
MCEECLTVHKLTVIEKNKNDELEGKDMFIFMYEINGGDLGLSDDQTDQSYI